MIIHLSERALSAREPSLVRNYPGREELERKVALTVQGAPAEKDTPD